MNEWKLTGAWDVEFMEQIDHWIWPRNRQLRPGYQR